MRHIPSLKCSVVGITRAPQSPSKSKLMGLISFTAWPPLQGLYKQIDC
jgi:hypothetical protein